ncbi:hypothetical protein AAFC00_004968 [Neodothiora populina]|uniref:Uncharacterized protein n=1 Tax=Neodothiora populina TaxID=2781224 RepID=A0ABR3P446_9PEZI
MVHADASNFDTNVSKKDAYAQVLEQARALFFEQRNWQSCKCSFPSLARPARSTCAIECGELGWILCAG